MVQENRSHLQFSPEKQARIRALALELRTELLDELSHLTPADRHELPKMGEKSVSFVMRTHEHMHKNAALVPSYVDVSLLDVDLETVNMMRDYEQLLLPVLTAIQDTMMLAGSEAYQAALLFYRAVKGAAQARVPGAEAIYNDLSTRFPATRRAKSSQPA